MNEYIINQYQEDYAVEHKRNILETPQGRTRMGILEAKFENLMSERMEENFYDD
jgi:hypothetical protein